MNRCILTPDMLETVRAMVKALFSDDKQAHGYSHAARVEHMALDFLQDGGNPELTSLIALLHDTDDYKLFPENRSRGTPNADRIMAAAGIPQDIQRIVRSELSRFGYSKRLMGRIPVTPEGRAVFDADMCDIMGAGGILRQTEYGIARGAPFFDPDDLPAENITYDGYMSTQSESACRHAFDKILRLPGLMFTEKGRKEALLRRETNIAFLRALFREQNASEWNTLLNAFLEKEGHAEKPISPPGPSYFTGPPLYMALYRFWYQNGELKQDRTQAAYIPHPFLTDNDEMYVQFPDDPEEIRFSKQWLNNPGNPIYPGRYVTVSPDPIPAMAELAIRYGQHTDTLDAVPLQEIQAVLYQFHYDEDGNFHRKAVPAVLRYANTGAPDDTFETDPPEPGNPFRRVTARRDLERPMSISSPKYSYISTADDQEAAKAAILSAIRQDCDFADKRLEKEKAWLLTIEQAQSEK